MGSDNRGDGDDPRTDDEDGEEPDPSADDDVDGK